MFTFRRLKAAEDVAFTLETTTDLSTWESGALLLIPPPVDNRDGTETRSYRTAQPLRTDPRRYFRLKLALP